MGQRCCFNGSFGWWDKTKGVWPIVFFWSSPAEPLCFFLAMAQRAVHKLNLKVNVVIDLFMSLWQSRMRDIFQVFLRGDQEKKAGFIVGFLLKVKHDQTTQRLYWKYKKTLHFSVLMAISWTIYSKFYHVTQKTTSFKSFLLQVSQSVKPLILRRALLPSSGNRSKHASFFYETFVEKAKLTLLHVHTLNI